MKNILQIIIIFFFTQMSFSQSVKGILVQRINSVIGDNSSLSEREMQPKVFSYVYSNKKSLQSLISKDNSSVDTTFIEKHGIQLPKENVIISQSQQSFYKDFEADIYKVISTTDNKDLAIKDKLVIFKWNLMNESKLISGYNCKKATTINKLYGIEIPVIAWYCEDIPLNDGPTNYTGLPGFIVQIEAGSFSTFTFEKLIFGKEDIKIDEPINRAKILTFKEYVDNR